MCVCVPWPVSATTAAVMGILCVKCGGPSHCWAYISGDYSKHYALCGCVCEKKCDLKHEM